jgi:hypothetical protein
MISSLSCRATQSPKRQNLWPEPYLPAARRQAGLCRPAGIALICICILLANCAEAQNVAIKTNALYWATETMNVGMEFGAGRKATINIDAAFNPWNRTNPDVTKYQRLYHWRAEAEYRTWLWERFNGHFFGFHALYSAYDISGRTVPFIFDNEHQYSGTAFGAGASYGFHLMISTRVGMEATVGVGAMRLSYDKSSCTHCTPAKIHTGATFIGPTKIGISLIYIIK